VLQWDNFNDSVDQKSAYKRRRMRESHEKSYLCQYENCNKAFFRKDHLVRHQRQKHGKPFGVDCQSIYYCYESTCNRSFYQVSSLHRHMVKKHSYG